MSNDDAQGRPEPSGSGTSATKRAASDPADVPIALAGELAKFATAVGKPETTARHLKAARRRSRFQIID